MKLRIHFDDGKVTEIEARYFTIYTRPDNDEGAEAEIHVEDIDNGNHWFGLSIITSISGINK